MGTVLYAPTALFVKASLTYILIKVFQPYYKGMVALYCLLAMIICFYFITTFIKIFICNPVSAFWNEFQKDNATCLSQPGVIIADSVISFVTDMAIFLCPVVFISSLQMSIWKKVKVAFILGFGGVAVAFSLYRLVIGIHERNTPDQTTMLMKSILTAYVSWGPKFVSQSPSNCI